MVEKVKGIVLRKFDFNDNKDIVKIYTETGTNSYMCYRKFKGSNVAALQPMTLVNFCSEKKHASDFAFLKDVQYISSVSSEGYELTKTAVAMFINEVLYKLLFNAGEDADLFDFFYQTLHEFYSHSFSPDFHLRFLLHSAMRLGSMPMDNYSQGSVFNIIDARFEQQTANEMDKMTAYYLHELLNSPIFPTSQADIVPYSIRNSLLDTLLKYYTVHIIDLSALHSLDVLRTVLHE